MARAQKIWKLRGWESVDPDAMLSLLDSPKEVRLSTSKSAFISIKDDSITLSGGFPSVFNIQGMSSSFKYGGMLQDLPFPLSLLPSTTFTPLPKQMMKPPFMDEIPAINSMLSVAQSLVGY